MQGSPLCVLKGWEDLVTANATGTASEAGVSGGGGPYERL
jgi:hypothetical protein